MSLRTPTAPLSRRLQSSSLERGDDEAGRRGRKVAAVRRERGRYVATTPRGRMVGEFTSRPEALAAVGRGPWSPVEPAAVWTALLLTVNAALLGSLAVVASALLN